MKKRSSKKDGFTLLEVVISMMLITILVCPAWACTNR
ncbi:prepilin-type N-terminal cleavage/methylation domain-containing protein [Clostridium butyricum]|nr:prepilin-type N-terminal cleavage/methylation domain-containing protein [Clostridium butyricum]RQN01606.1 prepilin-type N-terminal cleavage/methylation domain-containing protein [Clostridium butyricum]